MSKTEHSNIDPDKGKFNLYYNIALVSAIWFALTSMAWTYLINLMISLPFGILSLWLWKKGRHADPQSQRYQRIPLIIGLGILLSIISLIWFLIYE